MRVETSPATITTATIEATPHKSEYELAREQLFEQIHVAEAKILDFYEKNIGATTHNNPSH